MYLLYPIVYHKFLTTVFQTDDAFFNRTGLERIGVVRPKIGLLLGWSAGSECGNAGLQALDVILLWKDKKEEGSAGALPVTDLMPKSVPL